MNRKLYQCYKNIIVDATFMIFIIFLKKQHKISQNDFMQNVCTKKIDIFSKSKRYCNREDNIVRLKLWHLLKKCVVWTELY